MPEFASLFATVAVDQPVDATYSYIVPAHLRRDVVAGSRVVVPLGRGNRLTQATVLELSDVAPARRGDVKDKETPAPEAQLFHASNLPPELPVAGGIKPLADLLREVLPIPRDLLDLARWISTYYCCPIGMTLASMVPAAVKRATRMPSNVIMSLKNPGTIAEALAGIKISPKTRLVFENLHPLLVAGTKTEQELLTHAQIGRPALKRLVDLGLLDARREVKLPEPHPTGAQEIAVLKSHMADITLSAEQQAALREIDALIGANAFGVRLIHGVTGAGKTELYIRAIEKVVAQNKRAIVLVPEISLTPQAVRRFTARFPRVAVLHSGMKDSERHQHWHAIATGWAQVIVGARSAIFAPVSDLGLIVVDEEHDSSYKQDSLPKYHGRDVAVRRAQMLNVPVLLGSATPALESWHNAHHHPHWGGAPITLAQRPMNTQMPRVVTVDMKAEAKARKGLHILSVTLEQHLKQALAAKKQAIFLLNRRGYAHYLLCPRCDWVLMCDNCDATMVVHRTRVTEVARQGGKETGRGGEGVKAAVRDALAKKTKKDVPQRRIEGTVQCHYCLTTKLLPQMCPMCQARLTHLGQGTQRAEDELIRKFPELRIKRMDSDSMGNLGEYQQSLDAFGRGEIDLLIGTQMISKGLDFPNVSLVGVLNADLAMTIPDFRASERTFQLICQVAGRAGRAMGSADRGTVIVQTFQPQEPAIAYACRHDYMGFVRAELPNRKEFVYPPYGRLVRMVFAHKSYAQVQAVAHETVRLIAALTTKLGLPIRTQGPIPPPMERVMEEYRVEVVLFCDSPLPLQRLLGSMRARGALQSGRAGGVSIAVDVDPLQML